MKKLLPVVLIFAACGGAKTQTIKPENIYYDVEYREGVALYPPADTVYEVRTGDTIHVSWQHSLSIADSLDLEIEYDKTEGWEEIGKGLQDLDPVAVDWSTVLDLEEDKTYKFRIWAWRFLTQAERDTLLAETGIAYEKWWRSLAPSDEFQIRTLVSEPDTTLPDSVIVNPVPPMLIEIKVGQ